MSYKTELSSNNTDLQTILATINALEGGTIVESSFVPTNTGSTYKLRLADNNVDLQKILDMATSLPEAGSGGGSNSGGSGDSGGTTTPTYTANFADNSWTAIATACANNEVPSTWAVGDQKAMNIGGTDYLIDIIGKNHDTYTTGGTAPLTFQFHDCWDTVYPMNDTDTNSGGWRDCKMRTTTLPSILALMPSEVQAAIKEVNKPTALVTGDTTQTNISDKLFFLSEWELFAQTNWSAVEEGTRYEYYANGGNTIKNVSGTASQWWCRSVRGGGSSNQFTGANASGTTTSIRASRTMGVSPAFCFGNPVSDGDSSSGGTTPSELTVLLSGDLDSTNAYATINGVKYASAQSVSVELNTSVVVYVRGVNSSASNMKITLNGTVVAQGSTSSLDASYTFKVTTNTLISFTIVEDWMGITTTAAITTE